MFWLYSVLVFYLILVIGTVAALLIKKVHGSRLIANVCLALCLPFFGVAAVWLFEPGLQHQTKTTEVYKKEELLTDQSIIDIKPLPDIDFFNETNIAPADDMFLVSDYACRRRYLMNILKNSDISMNQMCQVRAALNNDDIETVHYAASGMQHFRQIMEKELLELSEAYEKDPWQADVAERYADVIDHYLQVIKLEGAVRRQFELQEIILLLKLVRKGRIGRTDRLIELLRSSGHCKLAETVSHKLFSQAEESEEKYLALLKFYFATKDRSGFSLTLSSLKNSEIIVSDEMINIIRLWTGVLK